MTIIEQLFKLFFDLLEALLKFIFEFLEALFKGVPKRTKGYNASFTSVGSVLSSRYDGFCLTGQRNLSIHDSYQNALIIGGTGTGKSSVVLIPSLFTMRSSFVVHDPSGELFTKSAGYLQKRGYDIKRLNFTDPTVSAGYNPLSRANSSSEIQKVASLLVENAFGGKGKDPFWNTQAIALLAMLITIVKTQNEEFQNLYNVRQLLNLLGSNPQAVDGLFSRNADEVLFNEYKSFIAYDEKVVNGVIATCKAALQIFSDQSVAKVTSLDTITFRDFRAKPLVLFIQNSVADQRYYSVLTSLFFEQLFSFILSRFPKQSEQDIFLLIDEASSLHLPTLPLAVANVRKHNAGIMLLVQDFAQLVQQYNKHDADGIKSNCFAKMYFTGQSLDTAKELEQTLGRYEYKDEKVKKVRSLMTNDEIRTMQINRALLICGDHPPIKARLRPYYKKHVFRIYSSLPTPNVKVSALSPTIPLLNLSVSSMQDA